MKGTLILTGSTGFVGQNLIRYLNGQFNIHLLTRNKLEKVSDVSLKGSDAVIHLAGKAHDLKSTSNADEYYKVNTDLTKSLYDAFLRSDAKKFIFISSVKAAADVVDGVLTEEFHPNPATHYGKSKLMAEDYIISQPLPPGKSYFIFRPCMIHGPGNRGNLNLLYQFVRRGIPYPLAIFKNKRSFLSIDNLCFIIQQTLNNDQILSGIYNIADDEALSTNEVVTILAAALGCKPRLWAVPKWIISTFAVLGDNIHLPLNSERLNKLTENYIVSNNKIKCGLEIVLPIKTREGLTITANSLKKAQL